MVVVSCTSPTGSKGYFHATRGLKLPSLLLRKPHCKRNSSSRAAFESSFKPMHSSNSAPTL